MVSCHYSEFFKTSYTTTPNPVSHCLAAVAAWRLESSTDEVLHILLLSNPIQRQESKSSSISSNQKYRLKNTCLAVKSAQLRYFTCIIEFARNYQVEGDKGQL